MPSGFALPSFDAVSLSRLLSKNSIEKATFIAQWILIGLAIFFIYLMISGTVGSISELFSKKAQLKNSIQLILDEGQSAGKAVSQRPEKQDYSVIYSRSVFGELGAKAQPAAIATPKPVSNLALTLVGTFLTGGKEPYAIIEDTKKGLQEAFIIKEKIFGEATLTSIASDRVEIERNGQKEVLMMDDSPSPDSGSKGGIGAAGEDTFVIEEAELDKAMENLPLLLTQARAVPYFQDGKSVGLRLFAIRAGSLFEKIGLLNGDIIKSINGNSLADFTQAMTLFQKLKEERSINLVLERNKQEKDFKYQIR
ncbi:MAG: hypothetical protein K1X83_04795 [Oligoflexia bacterium]|nr:hypothetical protein [Oligoflexia bacterium]